MKHVYSGHIHWGQSKRNITFVGNPYQMTRSDAGNKKGIYCLDLDAEGHQFYENTFSPKFVRFYLDKSLDLSLGRIKELCKNNFVDIYVRSEHLIKSELYFFFRQFPEPVTTL